MTFQNFLKEKSEQYVVSMFESYLENRLNRGPGIDKHSVNIFFNKKAKKPRQKEIQEESKIIFRKLTKGASPTYTFRPFLLGAVDIQRSHKRLEAR